MKVKRCYLKIRSTHDLRRGAVKCRNAEIIEIGARMDDREFNKVCQTFYNVSIEATKEHGYRKDKSGATYRDKRKVCKPCQVKYALDKFIEFLKEGVEIAKKAERDALGEEFEEGESFGGVCLIAELETEVFVFVQNLFFKQVKFPKDLIRSYIATGRLLPGPPKKLTVHSSTCGDDASIARAKLKELAASKNETQAEFLSRGIKKSFKRVLDYVQEVFGAK